MKAKKRNNAVIKSVSPSDTKNHKIHSITSSFAPSGGNRTKRIYIKGIPGSTFTLMAQDEDNRVYSFSTGNFNGIPSPLTGVIPPSGVFKSVVNTGRAKSVEVRLQSAAPDAITEVVAQATSTFLFTIAVDGTGLSNFGISGDTSYRKTISADGTASIDFSFTVKAENNKQINVVRNHRFNYDASIKDPFVVYDGVAFSSNELAHYQNQDGTVLYDYARNGIASVGITPTKYTVSGLQYELLAEAAIPEADQDHSVGFTDGVKLTGRVNVTAMGGEDIQIDLKLFNFLELK